MHSGIEARGREGFTLVEILVAIAIVAVLATMAVYSFRGLDEKYKVESETKQLYGSLMEVRGRAMQRIRFHFFRFDAGGYAAFADTNPAPDGNGTFEAGSDESVVGATVKHAIVRDLERVADNVSVDNVTFNRNGIPNATGQVWFAKSAGTNPDYDCITIRLTRIKMGRIASDNSCVER